MKRKIAALLSLLVFVMVSTAQASDVDPRSGTSPMASPIGQPTPVRMFTRPPAPRVEVIYQGVGVMLIRMR